ncbi:16S rRNA (cytosine(1402)-N(4))-methyltransferase [Candidatus Woesebacteria bacterium RBG_19FT_COMBO_47_8]|nr:MAG: 16S rRNA (cytosine(1402)-N(4))-methyltransferase [Candidatus Woesebacteria bacterium RBG_19FT_COMBO_47_8]
MEKVSFHEPVLVSEVMEALHFDNPAKKGRQARIIDATLGTGGHSFEIIAKGASALGIEADPGMLKLARSRMKTVNGSLKLVLGNFRDIAEIAEKEGFSPVDGVLFDLGTTSTQLTDEARGFSFANPEAPLDMRINSSLQGVTAADLLNGLRQDQLISLFEKVLNRFSAKRLVREVIKRREVKKFVSVGDFLGVTAGIRPKPGLNRATLPFLALRMAVNSELENLREALPKAFSLLGKKGRLLVITFHSGEEKETIGFFRRISREGKAKIVSKVPIVPGLEEISANPRARSAKLNILEKIK